jgi:hypothetical protein
MIAVYAGNRDFLLARNAADPRLHIGIQHRCVFTVRRPLPPIQAIVVSSQVLAKLLRMGRFTVVHRNQDYAILEAQAFP